MMPSTPYHTLTTPFHTLTEGCGGPSAQPPHPTLYRGVGVWCGAFEGGEDQPFSFTPHPHLGGKQ